MHCVKILAVFTQHQQHSQAVFIPRQTERVKPLSGRLAPVQLRSGRGPLKAILARVRPPVQSARYGVVAARTPATVGVAFAVPRGIAAGFHDINFARCRPGAVAIVLTVVS